MLCLSQFEPVHCFVSCSNCCFLTSIQASQETGKVVWYSHLFKNFPQFAVIHIVKGFSVVNEAEVDVFLELPCFLHDPTNVELSLGFSWQEYWSGLPFPSPVDHVLSELFIRTHPLWVALSSVQFSRSVMSDSLRPHQPQHARPPCPSPTLEIHPNSSPLSR